MMTFRQDKITGRVVAVKGFKAAHEDKDIMRLAMREAKMLEAVSHENVVRLITAFKSKSGRVYMVFDYAGSSVQSVMERAGGGLGGAATKLLSWQLLQAAAHLHGNKVLHRDIKPANILVDSSGVAKLCDFGFARAVRCGPREAQRCTSYVVTRWYRAPEVLVSDEYGAASDIWSVGCSIAEFAVGRALFPGSSTADQLWRIMRCFGPLPSGLSMRMATDPRLRSLCAPQPLSRNLRQRLPEVEPRLLELVAACLRLDPAARPTAAELLQMPYFWDVPKLIAGTQLAAALAAERREAARMMAARMAAKAAAAMAAGSDGGGGVGTVPPAPAAATAAAAAAGVLSRHHLSSRLAGAAKGCSGGGAAVVAGAGRLFGGTANSSLHAAVPQSLHSGMRPQRRPSSLRHMDSGGGLYTTTEVSWDEVGTPVGAPMLRADPGALLPHVRPPHGAPYQVPPPGCQSTVNSTTGSSSFLLPLYNGELQADMEAAATGGGGGVPSFTSTVHNGGSSRASGRLPSAAVRRSLTAGGGSESLGDIVEAVEVNYEAVERTGGGGDAGAAAAGRGGGGGSGNDRRKKSWLLSLRIPEDGRTAGLSGQVGAGATPGGAAGGGGGGGSHRRSGLIASLVGMMMMGGGGSAAGSGVVSNAGDLSPDRALVLPGGDEHGTPRNGAPDAHDPILSPDGDGVWGRHRGAANYTSSTPASRASGGLQQQQQRQRQIHSHNPHYSRSHYLTTAAGSQQQQRPQQNMQSSSMTDSPLSPTSPGGLQQQLKAAAASAASSVAGVTQEQQAYAQQQQQQQPLIGRSFSSTLGQAVSSRAMSRLRAAATAASGGVAGLSSSGQLGSSMPRTPPQQQQPTRGPKDIPVQRTCRSVQQSQPLPAWGVEQATMAVAGASAGGGGGSGRFAAGGYAAAVSGRTGLRQDPSATMLLPVPASAATAAVPGVDVGGSDRGSSSIVIPTVSTTITAEGLPRAMSSGGQSRCSLPTIVPAPAANASGSGTLPAVSPAVASGAAALRQLLTSGDSLRDTEEEASQSVSQQVVLLPPPRPMSAATARVVPYGGPTVGVAAPAVPVHHVASGVPSDGAVSSGTAAATSAAYYSGGGRAAALLCAQADQRQQLQPRQQPGKSERSSGGGLSRIVRAFKSAIKGKK
ncbi:hypothetical protein CHLRE_01g052800v5 [Chlamydomonas reinhardtii]|uniref:Protein kinase domain-containing protein n=1 Tax=Chlamydomonas reinhardtii TaxID=3055 RepID=A0A2K3E875_CHLRE|nr:uncharacterized protein CHLRE_01g052800v5 [Chlamydomonas reinhardtii]PNW88972.1 hypothetical protein CHLRE_01g052800v5 [Chlamydomonas reinhardtii]